MLSPPPPPQHLSRNGKSRSALPADRPSIFGDPFGSPIPQRPHLDYQLRVGRIVRFPARFVKICPNAGPAGLYRELSVSWILLANSPTKNLCISPNLIYRAYASETESSRPGEFHPQSLTEPDLTLSRRPALLRLTVNLRRAGYCWRIPSPTVSMIRRLTVASHA
jgi:hypothetical protein